MPRRRSASSVSGCESRHPRAHDTARAHQQHQREAAGEFIGEVCAQLYRAAVGAEHRGLVHRDQIVEAAVQLGEFAIVISAGRRGGDVGEQLVAAPGDIGGELGLADFSEVVILDVDPLQEIVPRARQHVLGLAVVLGDLQRVERARACSARPRC